MNILQINENNQPHCRTTPTTTNTIIPNHEPTVYQSNLPDIPLHNTTTTVMLCPQVRPHKADVETDQTPTNETHHTKTQEQEPQPIIALDSQDQISMKNDKDSEPSMLSKSTNNDALEIIRRRAEVIRIRKSKKTCRIAIQILQQETKNDKVRYFMRFEDPNTQKKLVLGR